MTARTTSATHGLLAALRHGDWLDRRRLLGYAVILGAFEIAVALFWVFASHGNLDPTGKPLGTDFISFWAASRLALGGTPELAYDPAAHAAIEALPFGGATIGYFSFFYPPIFLVICLPLALLPYAVALGMWIAVTAGAFALAVRRLLPRLAPVELLAGATFPAILINAGHGQNGFLSAALFAGGFLVLDRRPLLAGLLLGCLVFKPQLAILVPFALAFSGRWTALAGAAIAALGLAAASWLMLGSESWTAFVSSLLLAQATLSDSLVEPGKMVTVCAAARLLHLPSAAAFGLQLLFSGAMVAVLLRFGRQLDGVMLSALTVTATFLATPFAFDYDLMLLAIPLAVLFQRGREGAFLPYEKLALFCGFVLPLAARPLGLGLSLPVAPLVTLMLLVAIVRRVRSETASAA